MQRESAPPARRRGAARPGPGGAERPARLPGLWSPAYRRLTIGLVGLGFLTAFEALAVTTAMPSVAAELHGVALYGLAFAAPLAISIVSMTLAGPWNDRSGPELPLQIGVGLFAAGLIVAGSAPTMGVFVLGRALQGFGSGLVNVSLYVEIARGYPAALRPRMFTALSAAWVLPAVIGPGIAGLVTEHFGWRWVFLVTPLLAVAAALLLRSGRREKAPNAVVPPPGSRGLGALPWAVATAAGVLLLSWSGDRAWSWWPVGLAAAVALLVVTIPRLLPPGTWRLRRGIPTVIVMRGLIGAAFAGAEVFVPLMLVDQRGLSTAVAGLSLTAGALTWSLGSWIAGRGTLRIPARLLLGSLMMVVGIAAVASPLLPGVPVPLGIVGWALAGLGIGMAYPTLSVLIIDLSPKHSQGANASALQINEAAAQSITLSIGGAAFATLVGFSAPGAFAACFGLSVLLAAAAALVSGRASPREP